MPARPRSRPALSWISGPLALLARFDAGILVRRLGAEPVLEAYQEQMRPGEASNGNSRRHHGRE